MRFVHSLCGWGKADVADLTYGPMEYVLGLVSSLTQSLIDIDRYGWIFSTLRFGANLFYLPRYGIKVYKFVGGSWELSIK